MHICDGDKGGYSSYKTVFDSTITHTKIEDLAPVMNKDFFFCTNHAAQTVKKTLKSVGEEFNIIKKMKSREKILERLNDPKNANLRKWLAKRGLEKSLPAFTAKIWDKSTTQNVEVYNRLQKQEGARKGGHSKRAYNMINHMVKRWIKNKNTAMACTTNLVPKMELEKKRLISMITSYFDYEINQQNALKGVVVVLNPQKDMQLSKKKYEVELFPGRHQTTTMGGHCSCLSPQQRRIPCVHVVYYTKRVGHPVDNLFRAEHSTKY